MSIKGPINLPRRTSYSSSNHCLGLDPPRRQIYDGQDFERLDKLGSFLAVIQDALRRSASLHSSVDRAGCFYRLGRGFESSWGYLVLDGTVEWQPARTASRPPKTYLPRFATEDGLLRRRVAPFPGGNNHLSMW